MFSEVKYGYVVQVSLCSICLFSTTENIVLQAMHAGRYIQSPRLFTIFIQNSLYKHTRAYSEWKFIFYVLYLSPRNFHIFWILYIHESMCRIPTYLYALYSPFKRTIYHFTNFLNLYTYFVRPVCCACFQPLLHANIIQSNAMCPCRFYSLMGPLSRQRVTQLTSKKLISTRKF